MLAHSGKAQVISSTPPSCQTGSRVVQALVPEDEQKVLAFLAARPIHTVIMAGLIRDNGLVSPLNRGRFYGCHNSAGQLEGVALIGHITMVETFNDSVLELFAQVAQQHQPAKTILGERDKVARFCKLYAPGGQQAPLVSRELLFAQQWPVEVHESLNLHVATVDDLENVMSVHAQMAFEECGVNPLHRDPVGFRQRITRRIEQQRVWVSLDQGELIFKADVVSATPEAVYLEGIYINPAARGKGYGVRFVSHLTRRLLASVKSVCLLVNEKNHSAQACYRKAGYKLRGYYDTVYLQQPAA